MHQPAISKIGPVDREAVGAPVVDIGAPYRLILQISFDLVDGAQAYADIQPRVLVFGQHHWIDFFRKHAAFGILTEGGTRNDMSPTAVRALALRWPSMSPLSSFVYFVHGSFSEPACRAFNRRASHVCAAFEAFALRPAQLPRPRPRGRSLLPIRP